MVWYAYWKRLPLIARERGGMEKTNARHEQNSLRSREILKSGGCNSPDDPG
jgi:hypothetical protein